MSSRLPTPTGTLGEIVTARTPWSKSFALPGGKRRLLCKPSLVHYRDAQGALQDINLESMGPNLRLDKAPYILDVPRSAIAMRYQSRATGEVLMCELIEIGGVPIGALPLVVNPTRVGQDVRWVNCLPGLTITLRCQPGGVAWIKRLADATVPRSVTWRITRPTPLRGVVVMSRVRGRENATRQDIEGRRFGWPLELAYSEQVMSDDGATVVLQATETWTGRVNIRGGLVDDPIYPVEFDPTFQEVIAANNDDGHEYNAVPGPGNWVDGADIWRAGNYTTAYYFGGVRFTVSDGGVGPNSGATIDSATLTFDIQTRLGTPLLKITGDNVDDAAAWVAYTSVPSLITETTAKVDFDPPAAGSQVATITAIVQELVNRPGWAPGQEMRFAIKNDGGSNARIEVDAINDAAGAETLLDITYTAAGGATYPGWYGSRAGGWY